MNAAMVQLPGAGPGSPPTAAPDAHGAMVCRNHAQVASVARCETCLAPICRVCRFTWPGERHFCPACAIAPRAWSLAAHRRLTAWSLGLAAWSSLGLLILFALGLAGVRSGEMAETLLGYAMIFLCVLPGAVGFALGLTARSTAGLPGLRRLTLPILWHTVLSGFWLVVMLIGVFQTD